RAEYQRARSRDGWIGGCRPAGRDCGVRESGGARGPRGSVRRCQRVDDRLPQHLEGVRWQQRERVELEAGVAALRVRALQREGGGELGAAGGRVSFDLSTEITPIIGVPLTIGIGYNHKADQTLTGHAHFDNAPPALGPNTLDQGVTHDLTIPNLLNVGIAYRVLPNLLLTGAWTFDRFIVYKRDPFAGDLGTTVLVNRDYKNGHTFRIGGEMEDVLPKLTVRAGVLRDISPTRPEALSPTIPDSNSTAVALGLGYQISPGLTVNATYFHAFFDSTNTVG